MSAWTDHIKSVAAKKKISYKEAMKVAGETWKGGKGKAKSADDKPKKEMKEEKKGKAKK